ncbi:MULTISPECIES: hypothetical protein [Prauserella]|uniref:FCD domain-containing protein n=1 Tax=Prauserella endophytica TaxID=1592324 RepID=A0ABY2RYX9_9PSEU|nr:MULTISPECIES: hypothetical protein [Prauserella]TKG66197.1 hypothetical protein FCN18_25490 [Prauserella endophytica]
MNDTTAQGLGEIRVLLSTTLEATERVGRQLAEVHARLDARDEVARTLIRHHRETELRAAEAYLGMRPPLRVIPGSPTRRTARRGQLRIVRGGGSR